MIVAMTKITLLGPKRSLPPRLLSADGAGCLKMSTKSGKIVLHTAKCFGMRLAIVVSAFHKLLGNFLATFPISSNLFRFEQLFAF